MIKDEIVKTAARLGLGVQIWAPGDGKTRYEFVGPGGSQLCMGAREASVYLAGFEDGMTSTRNGGSSPRHRQIGPI